MKIKGEILWNWNASLCHGVNKVIGGIQITGKLKRIRIEQVTLQDFDLRGESFRDLEARRIPDAANDCVACICQHRQ